LDSWQSQVNFSPGLDSFLFFIDIRTNTLYSCREVFHPSLFPLRQMIRCPFDSLALCGSIPFFWARGGKLAAVFRRVVFVCTFIAATIARAPPSDLDWTALALIFPSLF